MKYISLELAKAQFTGNFQESYAVGEIKAMLDEVPTVDVAEVKHGEWIENDNGTYSCSICHSCITKEQYNYDARKCIHCGADMRGETE